MSRSKHTIEQASAVVASIKLGNNYGGWGKELHGVDVTIMPEQMQAYIESGECLLVYSTQLGTPMWYHSGNWYEIESAIVELLPAPVTELQITDLVVVVQHGVLALAQKKLEG